MEYITVKEASEKWNISTRRICVLCKSNRIKGAVKRSGVWMIPSNANKPNDGRRNDFESDISRVNLLMNAQLIESVDEINASKDVASICKTQNLFFSGKLHEAYEMSNRSIASCEDKSYLPVMYYIRLLILADLGEKDMYFSTMALLNSIIENDATFIFERLIFNVYSGKLDDLETILLDDNLYYEIIPLLSMIIAKKKISELIVDGRMTDSFGWDMISREMDRKNTPLMCAYFHLYLAVYYNIVSETKGYMYHIKKATEILLPRKWYTPLAEYSATIDLEFIREIDKDAYKEIDALSQNIIDGYIKLGLFNELVAVSSKNRETKVRIAYKIARGKNNSEIANELGISQYKVKQYVDDMCSTMGVESKKEIRQAILKNLFV